MLRTDGNPEGLPREAFDELRAALASGHAEVVESFFAFLERAGFNDIDRLRTLP